MDDNGLLAITAGKLSADDGMRTLDVVVDCLPQVVQQAARLAVTTSRPSSEAITPHRSETSRRVLKHVLTKRGTVAQGTKGLDDLRVQIVDAGIEGSLLASIAHALLNQVGSLVDTSPSMRAG